MSSQSIFPRVGFASALTLLCILVAVVSVLDTAPNARTIFVNNSDLFRTAFLMLTVFLTFAVLALVTRMGSMSFSNRALSFFGILFIVASQVLLFASMHFSTGLIEAGQRITPNMFQASYFSILIFTGCGMAEFFPVHVARDLVLLEAAIGFIFVPIVITAAFLLSSADRSLQRE